MKYEGTLRARTPIRIKKDTEAPVGFSGLLRKS